MAAAAAEAGGNLESGEGGPFGAVIVKDGKIVGRGHNRVLAAQDPTCHAEIEAIRSACRNLGTRDLSGCEIYTSCYPCPMCLGAIIWANIRTAYFGNTAEDAARVGFRDDYIYRFIENGRKDDGVLSLRQLDRDLTIGTFDAYRESGREIY